MASPSEVMTYKQSIELARSMDHMKALSRQVIENVVTDDTEMLRGHLSDLEAYLETELARVQEMKENTYVGGLSALFG